MNNMKEPPISNIEKEFICKAVAERKRLDGRHHDAQRKISIHFSEQYGVAHVCLGETRAIAKVSCEIQQPKSTRPNEGLLYINVELSPMAAVHFVPGRPRDEAIQLNRLLEKLIKDSKAVDVEALCIVADEKVWALNVDVTIINHDGNMIECASIAAITALSHFRRPDVTWTGEHGDQIIIHPASEKELLPLTLHHYPVYLSFALFDKGEHILTDPTNQEERVCDALMIIGMNGYRELCGLLLTGKAVKNQSAINQCVQRAGKIALEVIQLIKQSVVEDSSARLKGETPSFSAAIQTGRIVSLRHDRILVRINNEELNQAAIRIEKEKSQNKRKFWDEDGNEVEEDASSRQVIVPLGNNSAELRYKDAKVGYYVEDNDENGDNNSENEDSDENESEISITEDVEEKKKKLNSNEKSPLKVNEEENNRDSDLDIEIIETHVVKTKNEKTTPKREIKSAKKAHIDVDSEESDIEILGEITKEEKEKMKNVENIDLGSEEEETIILDTPESATRPNRSAQVAGSSEGNKKRKRKRNKKQKPSSGNNSERPKESRQWYQESKW